MKLSEKQKIFCKEYIIDFNATKAAVNAGYSKKTAQQIGSQNLLKIVIQETIKKEIDKRSKRVELKQDDIINELRKIAFSDIKEYIDFKEIKVKGKIKRYFVIKNLNKINTKCVSEISEHISKTGINTKFKLYDKIRALELLGKHLGIWIEKIEHSGTLEEKVRIYVPENKRNNNKTAGR